MKSFKDPRKSPVFQWTLFILFFKALVPASAHVCLPLSLDKPVLFVSRQIPCCGSVYMRDAKALPGIGNYSKFQLAAPGYLCILQPGGRIDTLINGARPTDVSLRLVDISTPNVSWDGNWIVFAGLREGQHKPGSQKNQNAWRIYVIRADGSGLRQLTFDEGSLDLSQFHPGARQTLSGVDDTHPVWLPDGRICFSSTRYRDIAMYNVARTSNLYIVNADGSGLHRITSEKNGADRPAVDPLTGRIVYARWWRNFYWPYDGMDSVRHPQYTNGWLYKDGLTSDLGSVIDGQQFMFNNNAFSLTGINPDGTGLRLFSGHYREVSSNSAYGGCFDREGNFIGNWFPIEHQTESSGFGGIRKYFRGSGRRPVPLAGITSYGNLDYYIKDPPSYGIFRGSYAAEPYASPDGRILYSEAPDPDQDYGIYLMDAGGSGKTLILDQPGTTELHAQFVEPRPLPPVLLDLVFPAAALLPPKGLSDLRQDGSFDFDCRNIYYNAGVDEGILAAPPVGGVGSVRFFASPLLSDQYGSLEMLNFPLLYGEHAVDDFGRVHEPSAPAHLSLFEQARTPRNQGYRVVRTGGGIMDGAGHVTGFNFGRPGEKGVCVGCHAGHTLLPVHDDPQQLFFTNVAPGARMSASASMNEPGNLIDLKNRKAARHWFTPEGVNPKGQWIKLHWLVPVYARELVLHNVPDTNRARVRSCKLQIFEDTLYTRLIREISFDKPLDPAGSRIPLGDALKMQALRLEFQEVQGGIYHWNAATLGEIELIASPTDPVRFQEVLDCKGKVYGPYRMDSCGQCLLPDDPKFNDCLTSTSNPPKLQNAIRIWPNPVSDRVYIAIEGPAVIRRVELCSLQGNCGNILTASFGSAYDFTQFPGGVYLLRIETDRGIFVRSVVKR